MLGPALPGSPQDPNSTCDFFTMLLGRAYEKREREREKEIKRRLLPRS